MQKQTKASLENGSDIKIDDLIDELDLGKGKHVKDGIKNIHKAYFGLYSDLDKVKSIQKLDYIELTTLKELYLQLPKEQECLLYLLLKRTDNFDDKTYNQNMITIFQDVYMLPESKLSQDRKAIKMKDVENNIVDKETVSDCPFDELFIWSLMLYSGEEKEFELIKLYLSRTKHPMACCLVAMILYNRFQSKHYVPDELKSKLEELNGEFQKIAIGILDACVENKKMIHYGHEVMVTQDLLLREVPIFFDRTCIDIAYEAEALDFIATYPVQDTITEIWYERINPDASNWKIFFCLIFLPLVFFPIRLFKDEFIRKPKFASNETTRAASRNQVDPLETTHRLKSARRVAEDKSLSTKDYTKIPNSKVKFRTSVVDSKIYLRPFAFLDAPLIKFIFHFIFYILFLILYLAFILFDYYPITGQYPSDMTEYNVDSKFNLLKITITEVILITWILSFQMDTLRQFYQTESPNGRFLYKLKRYFTEDMWYIYDIFAYLIFYAAVILRCIPKTSGGCIFSGESCFEAARVVYCVALIFWFARTLKFLIVLPFWGPKLIIIGRMIKQLLVFIVLLFLFVLPFGASFQSIMSKTSLPSASAITSGFNRVYWPIFGEIGGLLEKIDNFQCPNGDSSCVYGLYSFFLYIGLALYVIICNLLLLNMIIAIFGFTVEETEGKSVKVYKFQRYSFVKKYYNKTVLPAPFIIFEFIVLILIAIFTCCRENIFWTNSFGIVCNKPVAESEYNDYERTYLEYFLTDAENKNSANNANTSSEGINTLMAKYKTESDRRIQSLEITLTNLIEQSDRRNDDKLKAIKSSVDELLTAIKSNK